MSTMTLTLKQIAVLHFLREFQTRNGSMPTRAEIAAHFEWRSAQAAEDHLRALGRKNCVAITPGIARGIRLLPRAFEVLGASTTNDGVVWCIALPVIDQYAFARARQGMAA